MKLLYVVDPMCSWCYGFAPALEAIRAEFKIPVELVLGGLAPDSDAPMPDDIRAMVQSAWHAVEERTGVPFNHDFWRKCQPRRSTYPACRALLIAREAGRGWEMLAAIQRAYYREARNPSDTETLVALATDIGLDAGAFTLELKSQRIEDALQHDLRRRDTIGGTSFPRLGFEVDGQVELLASGCLSSEELTPLLERRGISRR